MREITLGRSGLVALARQYQCPRLRCGARPGDPCRTRVPQYTPLGFYNSFYGRPMKHAHPERLALVPEAGT